jgi:ubiquitin-protein ligase
MSKIYKTENHYQENVSQKENKSLLASQNWQGVLGIIAILTLFIYLMAEIRNIRSELKQDMRDLRIELKQEIKETNLRIDKLDAKIDKITDLLMSKNRG